MKAIRMHAYGGADVLKYEDAPQPQPAADEVLIRVRAAGVNPVDWQKPRVRMLSVQLRLAILNLSANWQRMKQ